jgi:hypothetical protein
MQKFVYLFDSATFEYDGTYSAHESPAEPGVFIAPTYSTDILPPAVMAGQTRHFVGGAWVYQASPAAPAPTAAELWAEYQGQAYGALAKTDSVAVRCIKSGVAYPSEWQTYTSALRAIVTAATGTPGTLPPQPAYPAGT